jgi:hypothetical protein
LHCASALHSVTTASTAKGETTGAMVEKELVRNTSAWS